MYSFSSALCVSKRVLQQLVESSETKLQDASSAGAQTKVIWLIQPWAKHAHATVSLTELTRSVVLWLEKAPS